MVLLVRRVRRSLMIDEEEDWKRIERICKLLASICFRESKAKGIKGRRTWMCFLQPESDRNAGIVDMSWR